MATALGLVVLAFLLFLWLARNTELVRDAEPCPDGSQKFSLARCQTAFWFFLFVAAYVFLWDIKRQTDSLTEQCLVLLGISTGTLLGSALIGKPGESPAAPKSSINPNAKTFGKRPLFHDLLSDPSGEIVFYRFQTLVWTLVLGLVFIKSVCFSLQMPEFGTNELTLMGISAGTYIGFKIPEAKAEAAKADKSQPETGSPTSVATPDQTPPPDKNV